jgi:hypothetical protein
MSLAQTRPAATVISALHVVRGRLAWQEAGAFGLIAALSVLVAFGCSALLASTLSANAVVMENGPHELLQAGTVALAGIGFLIAALRFDFEVFYVTLLGSLGSFLAALRETPGCSSSFYDGGPCVTATWKDLIPVAGALAAIALVIYRRVPLARRINELTIFWLVPVSATVLLLVAAGLAEAQNAVWIEETLELAAFANLLAFALVVHLQPRWFASTLVAANANPVDRRAFARAPAADI